MKGEYVMDEKKYGKVEDDTNFDEMDLVHNLSYMDNNDDEIYPFLDYVLDMDEE